MTVPVADLGGIGDALIKLGGDSLDTVGIEAVSYTHLDVYKRQIPLRIAYAICPQRSRQGGRCQDRGTEIRQGHLHPDPPKVSRELRRGREA